MPLLSKRAQEEGKKSSSSGVDRYLNPGKLEDGSSVRFSLLEENALDFYEVWGSLTEDSSKSRPYRFTDDPTPEDIEEAMAGEDTRRLNLDGTAPDHAKLALANPVYNYYAEAVQVLQFSQKTLITQLDQISQMDDYKDDLLEWDFVLAREGVKKNTTYSLRTAPKKKGAQKDKEAAWSEVQEAGFDITRLIDGTDPFSDKED